MAGISRGILALLIKDKGGSHTICLPFVKNGGMFVQIKPSKNLTACGTRYSCCSPFWTTRKECR